MSNFKNTAPRELTKLLELQLRKANNRSSIVAVSSTNTQQGGGASARARARGYDDLLRVPLEDVWDLPTGHPETVQEALSSTHRLYWLRAMDDEWASLGLNQSFRLLSDGSQIGIQIPHGAYVSS